MEKPSVFKSLMNSFCDYLMAEMDGLQSANAGFPTPSEVLQFPCLTVVLGQPSFEATDPYVVSHGVKNEETGKTPVRRVVGSYEIPMQVDLWSDYKAKRAPLFDQFFHAVNKRVIPMGLSLPLPSYYGSIARFHITGFSQPDGEEASQRKEWRAIVNVVCTVNQIIESDEHLVETTEVVADVGDSVQIEKPEEDAGQSII